MGSIVQTTHLGELISWHHLGRLALTCLFSRAHENVKPLLPFTEDPVAGQEDGDLGATTDSSSSTGKSSNSSSSESSGSSSDSDSNSGPGTRASRPSLDWQSKWQQKLAESCSTAMDLVAACSKEPGQEKLLSLTRLIEDNELAEQKARAKQRLIASRASPLMLVQAGVEIDMEELAGAANKNRGRPPSPQRTRFEMAL